MPTFTEKEQEWIQKIETLVKRPISTDDYYVHFNVLRWCYAYSGDIELAAKKLQRHLLIRKILKFDEDEVEYAPFHFLGNVSTFLKR
jgi:hypothetical protein